MSPLLIKHCNCLVKAHFFFFSKFFAQHIQITIHIKNTHLKQDRQKQNYINLSSYLPVIYIAKIPRSKLKISLEFAILKVI